MCTRTINDGQNLAADDRQSVGVLFHGHTFFRDRGQIGIVWQFAQVYFDPFGYWGAIRVKQQANDWPICRARSTRYDHAVGSGVLAAADAQLRWLYANCRALVCAGFESYGLTPIEAAGVAP